MLHLWPIVLDQRYLFESSKPFSAKGFTILANSWLFSAEAFPMRYLAYTPYNQKERHKWYNCVLKNVSFRLVISSTTKLHFNIHVLHWRKKKKSTQMDFTGLCWCCFWYISDIIDRNRESWTRTKKTKPTQDRRAVKNPEENHKT